jgi:putative ABC transport system permease protein
VAIQVGMGLAVPLLAALVPVIGGARITAHQAISSHGLGGNFGRGWLDRLLGRIRRLPRPLSLSLRNTFRRKARVTLTLLSLMLGGVMFLMVLSVRASFHNTLDVLLGDFGFDVLVVLERSYHTTRLIEAIEGVRGVEQVEVWANYGGQLALRGASGEEMDVGLWGVPLDSEMFSPRLTAGRKLRPGDDRVILLNSKIAADEGFQVGDQVELTVAGRETTWTVVGLVNNINNDFSDNFMPFAALARATGSVNRGGLVMTTMDEVEVETQAALINVLHDTYTQRGMEVVYTESASEFREENLATFNVITYLMLVMAVLAAIVGSVGLMSTMSINVVERGREIGMMRAIGATSLSIVGIFVAEGLLIGVLSWLLAAPLSYPGAMVFSKEIGLLLMNVPLDFSFPLGNLTLWLGIVLLFSTLASLWPALRATRVSVREALAYE